MTFSKSYIAFLIHFHGDRDYFECHEVLEEHWKMNGMERDSIWVGLIQVAVSLYHYRRGNIKGSLKLINKALHLLSYKKDEVLALSIDYDHFISKLKNSRVKIANHIPYSPINIPLNNQQLFATCKKQCENRGYEWGNHYDKAPDHIVHKHILRNNPKPVSKRQYALV